MSAPVSGADTRPLFTGDNTDDDAAVIDSFFVETDAPPKPVIEAIDPATLTPPVPTTVLRTGSVLMDSSYGPQKILNADKNRKELHLEAFSTIAAPTFTDYALVAFDAGLLTGSSAYHLRHNQTLDLSWHTGDVYLLPYPSITGAIEVSWMAVTL